LGNWRCDKFYPSATGQDYYALFLENPDRIEIEIVSNSE
jgi:hypothetical protein